MHALARNRSLENIGHSDEALLSIGRNLNALLFYSKAYR